VIAGSGQSTPVCSGAQPWEIDRVSLSNSGAGDSFLLVACSCRTGRRGSRSTRFQGVAACHSLERDRNMTGPSLAELWERTAGTLPSFDRLSDALKSSGLTWDDRTLDQWLADPQHLFPDNEMPFGTKKAFVVVTDQTKPTNNKDKAA